MDTLLKPHDLKMIASDAEMRRMKEEAELKKKKAQQQDALHEAFMSREVQPNAIERINDAVRIAAQNGQHQLQVLTFPASWCSDGGRRINNAEPDWPSTLEGGAKRGFEFYERELRPLGYKLHAEIISFPGGMPGDVAIFLKW
jgi:hypothetical protein